MIQNFNIYSPDKNGVCQLIPDNALEIAKQNEINFVAESVGFLFKKTPLHAM
jgi:hypothetical protein